MQVLVEGLITSIELQKKDDKKFTNLLLAQKGEKEQVAVRLPGDQTKLYTELQINQFQGRLMTWQTRNGVGTMVMVADPDEQ